MIKYIKQKLLENPESLIELLEYYGYCNFINHSRYITFGRDEQSSSKSISVLLEDNENLNIHDFAKILHCDVFSFIAKQRHCRAGDVIRKAKEILGIKGVYHKKEEYHPFNGFYKRRKKKKEFVNNTYPTSILDNYIPYGNKQFIRDGISLKTQRYFDIRYSVKNQAIIIPIHNEVGDIIGIKARVNHNVEDGQQKYFYEVDCTMSQTLYGYYFNYEYLENNDIYVFEAEKSVMQCHEFGIYNCVAIGSSTISKKQCQLLLSMNPKSIILMHDEGLDFEIIERNIEMIKAHSRMKEFDIKYWDSTVDKSIPKKASASDLGFDRFEEVITKQIKFYAKSY